MAVKKTTDENAYWNEKVPVTLPLDPSNPEDQTQYVSVGDYNAQILRGTTVMIPRNVARELERAERAKMEAFMNRQKMSAEYEQNVRKYL